MIKNLPVMKILKLLIACSVAEGIRYFFNANKFETTPTAQISPNTVSAELHSVPIIESKRNIQIKI